MPLDPDLRYEIAKGIHEKWDCVASHLKIDPRLVTDDVVNGTTLNCAKKLLEIASDRGIKLEELCKALRRCGHDGLAQTWQPQVEKFKEGILEKRRRRSPISNIFEARWVVLEEACIRYYDDQAALKERQGSPIFLHAGAECQLIVDSHDFVIEKFRFRASSKEIAEEWRDAINKRIAAIRADPTPADTPALGHSRSYSGSFSSQGDSQSSSSSATRPRTVSDSSKFSDITWESVLHGLPGRGEGLQASESTPSVAARPWSADRRNSSPATLQSFIFSGTELRDSHSRATKRMADLVTLTSGLFTETDTLPLSEWGERVKRFIAKWCDPPTFEAINETLDTLQQFDLYERFSVQFIKTNMLWPLEWNDVFVRELMAFFSEMPKKQRQDLVKRFEDKRFDDRQVGQDKSVFLCGTLQPWYTSKFTDYGAGIELVIVRSPSQRKAADTLRAHFNTLASQYFRGRKCYVANGVEQVVGVMAERAVKRAQLVVISSGMQTDLRAILRQHKTKEVFLRPDGTTQDILDALDAHLARHPGPILLFFSSLLLDGGVIDGRALKAKIAAKWPSHHVHFWVDASLDLRYLDWADVALYSLRFVQSFGSIVAVRSRYLDDLKNVIGQDLHNIIRNPSNATRLMATAVAMLHARVPTHLPSVFFGLRELREWSYPGLCRWRKPDKFGSAAVGNPTPFAVNDFQEFQASRIARFFDIKECLITQSGFCDGIIVLHWRGDVGPVTLPALYAELVNRKIRIDCMSIHLQGDAEQRRLMISAFEKGDLPALRSLVGVFEPDAQMAYPLLPSGDASPEESLRWFRDVVRHHEALRLYVNMQAPPRKLGIFFRELGHILENVEPPPETSDELPVPIGAVARSTHSRRRRCPSYRMLLLSPVALLLALAFGGIALFETQGPIDAVLSALAR